MNIITIGTSPYALSRNGRIHGDIIRFLKSQGHNILCMAFDHNAEYFLPEDNGNFNYEYEDKFVCPLIPFFSFAVIDKKAIYASQLQEIVKNFKADIILTIGNLKEVDFIYHIKEKYPNLFKWISIFTVDNHINKKYKDCIECIDYIISLSEFGYSNLCDYNVNNIFIPYGQDKYIFKSHNKDRKMTVLNVSKNTYLSNTGTFIRTSSKIHNEIEMILHINLYDTGYYNIFSLVDKYDSKVIFSDKFVSMYDGLTDSEMACLYNSSSFYVDCSLSSVTGISLLEAMSCGCIPIGMNVGRVGEIISLMPKEFQLFVPYEIFIGPQEEEFFIISLNELVNILNRIKNELFGNKEWMKRASLAAIEVASNFSNEIFLQGISKIIDEVKRTKDCMAVEICE